MYACSILPSHVHMVIARHERAAEDIVGHLKYEATRELRETGLHPFMSFHLRNGGRPTVWTKRSWKVYLDSEEDVERAVDYVEQNPVKEGKPQQRWSFVMRYGEDAPRTRGG